jgi:hypothetical protein
VRRGPTQYLIAMGLHKQEGPCGEPCGPTTLASNPKFLLPSTRRPRQIVLRPGQNVVIKMGDTHSFFSFEMTWPPQQPMDLERMEMLKEDFINQPKKSRLALSEE